MQVAAELVRAVPQSPRAAHARAVTFRIVGNVEPTPEDSANIRILAITEDGNEWPESWVQSVEADARAEFEEALWVAFLDAETKESVRTAPPSPADVSRVVDMLRASLDLAGQQRTAEAYGCLRWAVGDAIRRLGSTP